MSVAVAASPSGSDLYALLRFGEIVKYLAGCIIVDDRAEGNRDFQVFTAAAAFVAALPMLSPSGAKDVVEPEFQECVLLGIGDKVDVAAVTAVASAWPSARHKFFAAECNTAMAAVAGLDGDFRLVNEQRRAYSAGWILMKRPVRPLSSY